MNVHVSTPSPSPAAIESEQALLGAILVNNKAYALASEHVRADQFAEPIHARIYELCGDLISTGRLASPVSLRAFLADQDLGGITAGQYLARLAAEATSIITAPDYAKTVADMATRRELIARAHEMIEAATNPLPSVSASSIIESHEGAIVDVKNGLTASARSAVTVDEAIDGLIKKIQDKKTGKSEPTPTTGFRDLDAKIGGGWRAGRLYVVAGRPGMGKSQVGVGSCRKTAKRGNGAAFFALEIDKDETAARLVSSHLSMSLGWINYSDIVTGRISDEQLGDVCQAQHELRDYPIEIDCTPGLSVGQIETRAKAMNDRLNRQGMRLNVVFVDYLQLIAAGDRYKGSKVAEVGEIVLGLKNMSKRLDCAVVLFSQLSRDVEKRDDKRPMKSDLRDSGNIEEHADVIILLYRPNYYDKKIKQLLDNGVRVKDLEEGFTTLMENRKDDLELIIDKNRLGPTDTILLNCQPGRSLVEDSRQRDFEDMGGF